MTPPKMIHTEKDHETRLHILEAAKELFLARGFKGVSMKDIADHVQVTAAALYYHFPGGKQELFISMFKETMKSLLEQLYNEVELEGNLRSKLCRLTENALQMRLSSQMTMLVRDIKEYCRDKVDPQMMKQWRLADQQRLTTIFQHAIDNEEVAADIPASFYALMYQGIIVGLQMDRFQQGNILSTMNTQDTAAIIVDKLLHGIARH